MFALYISLRSEFYKSRKTLAFWASILLPLIICGLVALGTLSAQDRILKMHLNAETLWMYFCSGALNPMGLLILPFYVIFMAFSVNNIEHRNDTWKALFSQPLNRFSIYTAKYLFAVLLIFICLLLFMLLTWGLGNLIPFVAPKLRFQEYNPIELLYKIYFKLFLSALGMLSLQFIFSLLWADFLKPMGIGFIGVIAGIITASKGWNYAYLIPYSHPALVLSSKNKDGLQLFTQEIWTSLIYAIVLFITGYFIISRKSIK